MSKTHPVACVNRFGVFVQDSNIELGGTADGMVENAQAFSTEKENVNPNVGPGRSWHKKKTQQQ